MGNRLSLNNSVNSQQTTTNYTYDIANRLTQAGNATYTWDNNGNLLNDGVNTYTYDDANRLATVTQGNNSYTYSYNGLGDRLQQTVNSQTTNYALDLNAGLTQVLDDGTNKYTYGLDRISQQHGAAAEYFLGDALGSVRQLTDASGAVALTQSYDPYGNVISSTGTSTSIFGYTGNQLDQTGLTYLRARYYAPETGRFTQLDPMEDGNNWYSYTQDNPINYADPSGNITQIEAKDADWIVEIMKEKYDINIQKDWGLNYWTDFNLDPFNGEPIED